MTRTNLHSMTLIALAVAATAMAARAQETPPRWRNATNPEAVAALASGDMAHANAAWWGFDAGDATEAVQAAIDSGAREVLIPFVGEPWIVRPLRLRSHLELVLEPGVLLLAKRGEYRGGGDSLLSIVDAEDVTVRGYGATVRMWKQDYQNPPYEKAEWRMCLRILGSRNVLVEGVRLESSGGDGIYISGTSNLAWSENVTVRHVVCDDHHRQGISVISAENLLIDDCVLSNTRGTAPQAGIDFEPNGPEQRLKNCVVRNSQLYDNAGNQVLIYLKPLDSTSEDVSIRFENCHVREGKPGASPAEAAVRERRAMAGYCVGACTDNGPGGTITFEDCTSEFTGREGARVYDVSRDSVAVAFVRCTWAQPWSGANPDYKGPMAAVQIHAQRPQLVAKSGGIRFEDCAIIDEAGLPAVTFHEPDSDNGLFDVTGTIYYRGPGAPEVALGEKRENVSLEVIAVE